MNHIDIRSTAAQRRLVSAISPIASDRVRSLAIRIIEGAPALTAGEMRELAEAILEHNRVSEASSH